MSARDGVLIWITGLPSSGKSTFAAQLHARLVAAGEAACVLDGDAVRAALVPRPGYGAGERDAFYETLTNLAALLARQDLVVIVPATATRAEYRERARRAVQRFLEVEIATPLAECERRDSKGLYGAARSGRIPDVPGVGVAYEPPREPDVVAGGGRDSDALEQVLTALRRLRARPETLPCTSSSGA